MGRQLWRSNGPTFCWKQGLRLVCQQPCQSESWVFPVRQIAPLVWQPVSNVQFLRNRFCASISVSSCGGSCRLSSGCWDPQARGHEVLTLCRTKGPARGSGTQRTRQELMAPDFGVLRLWDYKSLGFCSGFLLRGSQLELLFCYCTLIKLF